VTEQDSVPRAHGAAPEHRADPLPEIHCQATTRNGQPCRNRPLDGQSYCRVHAPLDGAYSAAPSQTVTLIGSTDEQELPIGGAEAEPTGGATLEDAGQAEAAAAVQELEVEIRNHDKEAATRDLAAEALRLIRENLRRMAPEAVQRAARLVRENLSSDYLDPDFWRGIGMVLQYQVEEIRGLVQRRMRGEYTVDADGMDAELIEIVRPFSAFLYRTWWRVTAAGLENVPGEGRALLIANHSGVLPWDAVMIATAVLEEHAQPRVVRTLFPSAAALLPGAKQALSMFGQVEDTADNAARLLEADELVAVFPEGVQGLGKLFKDRYKLGRFRRGGSVGLAIASGAPIIPVAVVGAEEAYPMLADIQPLAQALRLPFFPLTPLFPWLGPLGLIPLPTKWSIAFGEPIATDGYGPDAASDPLLTTRLAERVHGQIQTMLDQQLAARKTVFS
jgi:1-acyl-sn-glycerol-3-phosphate acyltransferase